MISRLIHFIRVKGAHLQSRALRMFGIQFTWRIAQTNETKWWQDWLQTHSDDDRWLNTVLGYFHIKPGKYFHHEILMDIGSGPLGILTKLKARKRIAVDPLFKHIAPQDKTIIPITSQAENIPLPSDYAHRVFIYNVLQHVVDPKQVLAEAIRIAEPGGKIYILEQLNRPPNLMHPHKLTIKLFDKIAHDYKIKVDRRKLEKDSYFGSPNAHGTDFAVLCLVWQKTHAKIGGHGIPK